MFPAGGAPAPGLIAAQPESPVAGVLDVAGAPFWFNGRPRLVLDPRSTFPVGGTTVDGRTLVGSGQPLTEGGAVAVGMHGSAFSPREVAAVAGEPVLWRNDDAVAGFSSLGR